MKDSVTLLSLGLLDDNPDEIAAIEKIKKLLGKEIGWCYPLDITWILKNVKETVRPGGYIIDAGAGGGVVQFLLVEMGYNVISVDFSNRSFTKRILERYSGNIFFLNNQESEIHNEYTEHLNREAKIVQHKQADSYGEQCEISPDLSDEIKIDNFSFMSSVSSVKEVDNSPIYDFSKSTKRLGNIFIYKADFRELNELADSSVDCVVSCSAVEHSDKETVKQSMDEFKRVLKDNAPIFITTSASIISDKTYFHSPSQGYCYSKKDILDIFELPDNVASNLNAMPELLEEIQSKENNYLFDNLASFYFDSGNNGMPFGKWDIQYMPVGIKKANKKTSSTSLQYDSEYKKTLLYYKNHEIQKERAVYLSLLTRITVLSKEISVLERKRKSLIEDKANLQKENKVLISKRSSWLLRKIAYIKNRYWK